MAVLAGGLATRLYPMTANIPKLLLPIGQKLFVDHLLTLLRDKGIQDVVLCVGHFGNQIENYVGDGGSFGLRVKYSYDGKRRLGTGGAIRKALHLLGDEFFVLYGDAYLDISYSSVFAMHAQHDRSGLMTVFKNKNKWDSSNIIFQNGKIICYDKKNKMPEMEHIDYGLSILKARVMEAFTLDEEFDLADVFQHLISKGEMSGYEVYNRFYEFERK